MDDFFDSFLDQHTVEVDLTPEWAQNNKVSQLAYETVIKRAIEIEVRLKKTPEKLMDKLLVADKQIVVAKLAKDIGCTRAALTKSRRPELHALIEKVNVKLAAHYKINAHRKSRGRQPRKDELEARCDQLKSENDELKHLKIGGLIEGILSSDFAEEQVKLVTKLDTAKHQLNECKEKTFNQYEKIQSLMKQVDVSRTRLQETAMELDALKAELDAERKEKMALSQRVEKLLHQLNSQNK